MPVDNVGIDSVALLGAQDHPDLTLREQASFEVPLEDWILGASPVGNYMPAISVFRLMSTPDVDGLDPASQTLPGPPG
jgi:hypothetical protein